MLIFEAAAAPSFVVGRVTGGVGMCVCVWEERGKAGVLLWFVVVRVRCVWVLGMAWHGMAGREKDLSIYMLKARRNDPDDFGVLRIGQRAVI